MRVYAKFLRVVFHFFWKPMWQRWKIIQIFQTNVQLNRWVNRISLTKIMLKLTHAIHPFQNTYYVKSFPYNINTIFPLIPAGRYKLLHRYYSNNNETLFNYNLEAEIIHHRATIWWIFYKIEYWSALPSVNLIHFEIATHKIFAGNWKLLNWWVERNKFSKRKYCLNWILWKHICTSKHI